MVPRLCVMVHSLYIRGHTDSMSALPRSLRSMGVFFDLAGFDGERAALVVLSFVTFASVLRACWRVDSVEAPPPRADPLHRDPLPLRSAAGRRRLLGSESHPLVHHAVDAGAIYQWGRR